MPCLIVRGNEGNEGGIDTKVHVGMISSPDAEVEGWIHELWKLGFLGLENALALAGDVGGSRRPGAATIVAWWIGWLGRVWGFRVESLRHALPRLGGTRE